MDDTLDIDAGAQTEKGANQGVLINDTDPDGDPLSVDSIRTGQENKTGTSGTIGTALTGTYGDLTMNSDGSYIYQANNAKALNPGETATTASRTRQVPTAQGVAERRGGCCCEANCGKQDC